MREMEYMVIQRLLEGVPVGSCSIIRHHNQNIPFARLADSVTFSVGETGRGLVHMYPVLPGLSLFQSTFEGKEVRITHEAIPDALIVSWCEMGRAGWEMPDKLSVYLGEGELSFHKLNRSNNTPFYLPQGFYQTFDFCFDFEVMAKHTPHIVRDSGIDLGELKSRVLQASPIVALRGDETMRGIFHGLRNLPERQMLSMFRLKGMELLLAMDRMDPKEMPILPGVYNDQISRIHEINHLLTTNPEKRYTIEELSRMYYINRSTLISVFKAVYGKPIASYMKEFRIRLSMDLIRETPMSIAEVSAQVGYETQSKFSKAFKEYTGVLPTDYRKLCRFAGSSN